MKILVVDDEKLLVKGITFNLENEGYEVTAAYDGAAAVELAKKESFDLIILDLMMPFMDGMTCRREMRARHINTPVIILTARGEEYDKLAGLEGGADDYVVKPFSPRELVARVKAVLRRTFVEKPEEPKEEGQIVRLPDLTVNLTNYSVTCMGEHLDMPPKELELLYFLASSPNQVFTREQLLDHIWGYEYIGDTRTVDVHIKRLREKIKDHPNWSISTVWGIGYKFEVKSE